jgi:hypothetical protein
VDIAYCAGAGYELAFFGLLEKRIDALIEAVLTTFAFHRCNFV